MATTIHEDCVHCHADPSVEGKQFFGNNFDNMVQKDGHVYGCDRGSFKDDHCNTTCSYKEIRTK